MTIYVVQPGDNVDLIAEQFGIPVSVITYDNQLTYPYRLAVGQALYIDTGQEGDREPLYVSGYAYPFIDPVTLEETLTWLTDLYVFSYGFTGDGHLIYPQSDDVWMVDTILQTDVRPVLTLTPLDSSGNFNNNIITALINNEEAIQQLYSELIAVMQEKGYEGLDIDFEYIVADDREAFADFVSWMTQNMNARGYPVTVALAPKTSSEQSGVLYEGMDYRLLGEAANRVLLMTYEWGYTYGPPMAVAPIDQVRRVVEYAVSEIPTEKISLGIPNYGYDWPLPYERGVTRARTISNLEAVQLAVEQGVEIQFDQTAMSPFFTYWQNGIEHVVWFEDPRSIKAKFDLIKEFNLSGAGYWQLMNYFRANWLILENMFLIERKIVRTEYNG
ncbi:MAG: glycosyl hydrolase family 18 protein [Lachnospiraceae bacterium]